MQEGVHRFQQRDQELTFKIGTIIVATDMEVYDPTEIDEHGYRCHDDAARL
jgi:heterodisulfide reductase subunit A